MFMISFATNVEAQNARKKVWDSAKKAWVWVEEKMEKAALEKHRVRPHTVTVPCDRCWGAGKFQVTVPVTVWNPYYQCFQTQYQTQIQYCAKCQGGGWIRHKVYY